MTEPSEAAKAKMIELVNMDGSKYQQGFLDDDSHPAWATSIGKAFARFIQQVSDAAKRVANTHGDGEVPDALAPFILPEPVDPLNEAFTALFGHDNDAEDFRKHLAKHGLKIVKEV